MSSPGARQRRRREQYQAPRSRREIAIAAGAGLFIISGTALMIWMLRPGGIADRQPRSSWLFGIAFFAAVLACYVILRPGSRLKFDRRISLAVSLGTIVVVTALVGIFWPNGLLRHTPKPFEPPATIPTAPPATSGTTATTGPAATTTTVAGGTTSTASTTPGGTVTPSTKSTAATTTSTIP